MTEDEKDNPRRLGTPIEEIAQIRVGTGQWNFATFSQTLHGNARDPSPEEIANEETLRVARALQQLARGVEPPPAPRPVTRLLTEEEEQGYFTIGRTRVHLYDHPFGFAGNQAEGKIRSTLKRLQAPLEELLGGTFGKPLDLEVDYFTNAVTQINAQCDELTLPMAVSLYLTAHDVGASLMPLPGTSRALYQVTQFEQVLGAGLIYERGKDLITHPLRELREP